MNVKRGRGIQDSNYNNKFNQFFLLNVVAIKRKTTHNTHTHTHTHTQNNPTNKNKNKIKTIMN
jgi:hypothetical protein